jgi:hypothetical protein
MVGAGPRPWQDVNADVDFPDAEGAHLPRVEAGPAGNDARAARQASEAGHHPSPWYAVSSARVRADRPRGSCSTLVDRFSVTIVKICNANRLPVTGIRATFSGVWQWLAVALRCLYCAPCRDAGHAAHGGLANSPPVEYERTRCGFPPRGAASIAVPTDPQAIARSCSEAPRTRRAGRQFRRAPPSTPVHGGTGDDACAIHASQRDGSTSKVRAADRADALRRKLGSVQAAQSSHRDRVFIGPAAFVLEVGANSAVPSTSRRGRGSATAQTMIRCHEARRLRFGAMRDGPGDSEVPDPPPTST